MHTNNPKGGAEVTTVPIINEVKVYLTAGQCKYLGCVGFVRAELPVIDQVITMTSDDGWIFVERADTVGEEGSGVWVDANGQEQHGPSGRG
jgi:hypothetical protein